MRVFILIIFSCLFSCKKDMKKNNSDTIRDTIKMNVENPKPIVYKGKYLYRASVKSGLGANLKDIKTNIDIVKIPFNSEVLITKFLNFETITVMNKVKVYGKWVEVIYQTDKEVLKGKIFDAYLNYEFNLVSRNIHNDTIVVKNEKDFFKALRSNRTIIVDTEEINLDKGKDYIENAQEEEFDYGISYEGDYDETLILSNFNNLEIRGNNLVKFITKKEDANVITFKDCSNIHIDNINFYHKEVGKCDGDVLKFEKCDNFYFQNSHFDGSGLIAINTDGSTNINFLNCDFYNNHYSVVFSHNTKNITLTRCNIYGNILNHALFDASGYDYKSYIDCENKVSVSEGYIIDNELSSLIESDGKQESVYHIENSLISSNDFSDDIINIITPAKLNIKGTGFIENVSTSNKYIIDNHGYNGNKILLDSVLFKNNIDFYDFKRDATVFTKNKEVIINNVYNKKSDTLMTEFNRYNVDGTNYIERSDIDFKYNDSSKEFSTNGHLLRGLHKLNFSEHNKFYLFNDKKSYNDISYVGYGEIVNGKLEGVWEISCVYFKDIVEFKDGVLQKMRREIVADKKSKEVVNVKKGEFVNGKKEGLFSYYYEDGAFRKKLTFKSDTLSYPQEYYFPNGQLRFVRTKNKATHYHLNGNIIAEIVYDDQNNFIQSESNYYDFEGNQKESFKIPQGSISFYIDGGVSVKLEAKEKHRDMIFVDQVNNVAEFLSSNFARYKLPYSDFMNKSLGLKVGSSDHGEVYFNNNKKHLYIFDRYYNLKYKAVTENDRDVNVTVYSTYNHLKKTFKQYKIIGKNYVLEGDVEYYSNGRVTNSIKYKNGKIQ